MTALDEEEQSRWENETVSSSWSKIEDKGKDEPAEPDSQESLQPLVGQTIFPEFERNTNLVAQAAEFRSCKGYFPPIATFEPALYM